jgi:uncharacterized MAPEG superfamily protein
MLFLLISAVSDTVLVRQVPPVRTAFEQVVFVASGLTSVLILVAVVVLLLMLLGLRAVAKELHASLREVLAELRPLTQNANAASQDVRDAVAAAKGMVLETQETVTMANARVRETVTNLTDRVDDVTEMVGRIYDAGERVATVATTAMGGIKAGARFFGMGRKRRRKRPRGTRSDGPRVRPRDD